LFLFVQNYLKYIFINYHYAGQTQTTHSCPKNPFKYLIKKRKKNQIITALFKRKILKRKERKKTDTLRREGKKILWKKGLPQF